MSREHTGRAFGEHEETVDRQGLGLGGLIAALPILLICGFVEQLGPWLIFLVMLLTLAYWPLAIMINVFLEGFRHDDGPEID